MGLTKFVVYLLSYSIVQSPSWEANWFAASQEIPRISRNPKAHYCTHKRLPSVSILAQPNPVHIPTSHLLEIHPNIIHPSTPRSPQWSPSLRFPRQDPIQTSSPIRATCPAHLILLDFITRTILGEEYRSFSSTLCSLLLSYIYMYIYIQYTSWWWATNMPETCRGWLTKWTEVKLCIKFVFITRIFHVVSFASTWGRNLDSKVCF